MKPVHIILSIFLTAALLFASACSDIPAPAGPVQGGKPGVVDEVSPISNHDNPEPEPQPEPEPEPETETKPDTKSDPKSWNLSLVNKKNPLSGDTEAEMVPTSAGYKVDARILEPLNDMILAASLDGIDLYIHSALRTVEKQRENYDKKIASYLAAGKSKEEAVALTEQVIAIPGCSEHHTGLAVDITSADWVREHGRDPLVPEFADSPAGKWLLENAADYGFILRYPADKTDITEISFEPWHFRYVGAEDAKIINDLGFCLEEYIEYLQK